MRQGVADNFGGYFAITATADGNDAKTSIVASGLKNLPNGLDEGAFEGWYGLSLNGANLGQSRRVSLYIPEATAGPTLLVQSAYSNQTANGDTFELYRYDPALFHNAINRALTETFPVIYLPVRSEKLVVDSVLLNGDFEDWTSGAPDNWTDVNSPTESQESSKVYHGTYSGKLTAPAGSVGQWTQSLDTNISEISGNTAIFKARVWTDGASQARLRLDWDGTNFENGDYHCGDSEWELLSVDASVPASATQVKVIFEVAAGATAYIDGAWAAVGPVYKYTVPSAIIRGPFSVEQQWNEADVDGPYYRFIENQSPKQGRFLRLRGMGLYSQPSTDSATAEIDEPKLSLVLAYATMVLWRQLWGRASAEQRQTLIENIQFWQAEVQRLSGQPGIRMLPMSAQVTNHAWHIEEDSSGRYLLFDVSRGSLAGSSLT